MGPGAAVTDRPGATGSKHVYAGTSRIATKLMRQDAPNSNPNGNTPFEKDLYFYHPDHLGSSSYITDLNGKLYEHLEYFPFGESWVEENSNVQRTPYHFTAKELDEETGLYYFGARYYDPRTSVWQSTDPILGKYLPNKGRSKELDNLTQGGVFNSKNIALYSYAYQHPLNHVDPDGNVNIYFGGAWDAATKGSPIYESAKSLTAGTGTTFVSPNKLPDQFYRTPTFGSDVPKALAAIKAIKEKYPNEPINVIGHSWGGKSAVQLVNALSAAGIKTDLLVTVDPVSIFKPDVKDTGIDWINLYIPEADRIQGSFPDDIAKTGSPWESRSGADVDMSVTDWPGKKAGESGHMGILNKSLAPALQRLQQLKTPAATTQEQ